MVNEIQLIKKTYAPNEIGNMVATSTISTVIADISSVSAKEFFDAGQNGLKPDKKFTLRSCEYHNETQLKCDNDVYSIYRTYNRDNGRVELYTEKRVNNE